MPLLQGRIQSFPRALLNLLPHLRLLFHKIPLLCSNFLLKLCSFRPVVALTSDKSHIWYSNSFLGKSLQEL